MNIEPPDVTEESIGIYVGESRVWGKIEVEAPCALGTTLIVGECTLGSYSYFNYSCEIANVDIGRYCSIGQYVLINPGRHPVDYLTTHPIGADPSGISAGLHRFEPYKMVSLTEMSRPIPGKRAVLGSDIWVGAKSTIMAVSIGHGAIVAAGSVVTKDIEPYTIVGGSPARVIRARFDSPLRDRLLASEWWRYDLSALPVRDYSDPIKFLDLFERAVECGDCKLFNPEKRLIGV